MSFYFHAKKLKEKDKYPWRVDDLIKLLCNRFPRYSLDHVWDDSESGKDWFLKDSSGQEIRLATNKCYNTSHGDPKFLKIYEDLPFNETVISTSDPEVVNYLNRQPQMKPIFR